MKQLFSEAGRQRLQHIVRPGVLCVFDFDGTLVPITDRPEAARLPQDAIERLQALSVYAPVAILTGRSVADIRQRLGFEPIYVVGNHGLEGVPGWQPPLEEHAAYCHGWRQVLESALADHARYDPNIWIEDKRYSLSVHYRAARDLPQAASRLETLFARLAPAPRVVAGKAVFNLLPQDGADKGKALEQLMIADAAASAIYIGDDITDEDVFRLRRPDVLTVRVEPAVDSEAEFFVDAHADVASILDELIHLLRMQQIESNSARDLSQA